MKAEANRIYKDTSHLSGLAKKIADTMVKYHGYYTYTNAETNEKCYIGN
jgi:hypothetical protein